MEAASILFENCQNRVPGTRALEWSIEPKRVLTAVALLGDHAPSKEAVEQRAPFCTSALRSEWTFPVGGHLEGQD